MIFRFECCQFMAAKNQNHLLGRVYFCKIRPNRIGQSAQAHLCATRKRSVRDWWRAWPIRRRTISKPAKTDIFNRVFASGFDYWLSRGDVATAILLPRFLFSPPHKYKTPPVWAVGLFFTCFYNITNLLFEFLLICRWKCQTFVRFSVWELFACGL